MPHRRRRRLLRPLLLLAALTALPGLAACAPVSNPQPSAAATPTRVPTDAGATPGSTATSQTDTDWGRIWDALPAGFPQFAGASPTETGEGPASATLDVGDAAPAEVATFYQSTLETAGYSTVSMSGPREDGSIEIQSTGDGSCQVRTTIAPLGGTTIVTILYGAGCPFG
ncbi:MAG: hypothetical protein ABIV26_00610 [Candidatus Limnocylindrales bacterium]